MKKCRLWVCVALRMGKKLLLDAVSFPQGGPEECSRPAEDMC